MMLSAKEASELLGALRHALGEGDGEQCPHMKHYGTSDFAGAEKCAAFKVLRSVTPTLTPNPATPDEPTTGEPNGKRRE